MTIPIPVIHGVIARRVLVNFRVKPEIAARWLPPPFRPKLVRGWAMAGVCLIRLEKIRPLFLPAALGIASENAAHRIAVEWDDGAVCREGVFIPRRDTDSRLNQLAGGRLFPGVHHPAAFRILDANDRIEIDLESRDGEVTVRLAARVGGEWPAGSVFGTLEEATAFYEAGDCGWSPNRGGKCLDGLALRTGSWRAEPLEVECAESSFFADPQRFPPGSVELDCALLLRDLTLQWHALGTLRPSSARRGGRRRSRSAFFDDP
jgi:hypothetical protein